MATESIKQHLVRGVLVEVIPPKNGTLSANMTLDRDGFEIKGVLAMNAVASGSSRTGYKHEWVWKGEIRDSNITLAGSGARLVETWHKARIEMANAMEEQLGLETELIRAQSELEEQYAAWVARG